MVKMETSHPIDGPFDGESSWIYNHVAELWQPEVVSREFFFCKNFAFLEKMTPYGKVLKFCSKRIHRLTDRRVVFKFHEIWPTGIR